MTMVTKTPVDLPTMGIGIQVVATLRELMDAATARFTEQFNESVQAKGLLCTISAAIPFVMVLHHTKHTLEKCTPDAVREPGFFSWLVGDINQTAVLAQLFDVIGENATADDIGNKIVECDAIISAAQSKPLKDQLSNCLSALTEALNTYSTPATA